MRIGIYGYGNLGRGVEAAVRQNDDMELVAVFTRRNPDTVYPAACRKCFCHQPEKRITDCK